jgi:hypothetical protein
MLLAQY